MGLMDELKEFDERARDWQRSVIQDERNQQQYLDPVPTYSDNFVKTMIVHTRQDVILLVSYLSSLNIQICSLNKNIQFIFYLLLAILVAIICLIVKK